MGNSKIIPLLLIKSFKKPQIKKFKIHFRNFQKPKIKLQKDPLKFQKLKTYIRRPQIKKFYKTGPPKVGILLQNTISKFSKTKNQKPTKQPEGLLGAQRAVGGPKGPPALRRS